jgi:DNA repair exonuclease SbcCD nuclease subunit
MKRASIISDPHFGIRGRFSFLDEIKKHNLEQVIRHFGDADYFFSAADEFDSRLPDSQIVSEVSSILSALDPGNVFLCSGNHDSFRRKFTPLSSWVIGTNSNGNSGAALATGECSLFPKPFVLAGWNANEGIPECPDGYRFLVSHVRVAEWTADFDRGIKLEDLARLGYEAVFLGDLHTPKQETAGGCRFYSVGTFGASSFKDDGIASGFGVIEWDDSGFEFKRKEFINYPIFKTLELDANSTVSKEELEHNIVRIRFSGTEQEYDRLKIEACLYPRYIEFEPLKYSRPERKRVELTTDTTELLKTFAMKDKWPEGTLELCLEELGTGVESDDKTQS